MIFNEIKVFTIKSCKGMHGQFKKKMLFIEVD